MKAKRILYILLFGLGLASCLNVRAQNFTASVSRSTVGLSEKFELEFTVEGNGSNFVPPSFDDFQVVDASQSSSYSFNSATGVNTRSSTYLYILIPKKEGTFTINPASITVGNKKLASNPVTVKVVKGTAPKTTPQATAAQPGNTQASKEPPPIDKKYLFTRLVPSKTKVFVGEELTVTLKVYHRIEFADGRMDPPDYIGFYKEDIPRAQVVAAKTTETVDGISYLVESYPQNILFPQHAGSLKIGECKTTFIVEQQVQSSFFGMQVYTPQDVSCYTKTAPFTIEVMPLPKTEKNYSGAVGQFSLKWDIDKKTVKANEAVNLSLTISGNGNLKLIDTLPLQFPPDFDHYDPKLTDHLNITASGVSGSRIFNYVVIPRHQGKFSIPPVNFTYFDPSKKSFVTLNIPQIELDVAKGDNNSSAVTMNAPVNKEDIKVLSSDIRYIHTGHLSAYQSDDYFLYSVPFLAGILSPLLAFIGFLFARRRYIELHKDAIGLKQRGATRMAKKRLKTANSFILSNNKEKFYDELHTALNSYLSDKFTIPIADLSRETITNKLTEKSVGAETLQQLSTVLDNCEFARYAPASVTGNLNEVYESAVKLITKLEDEIAR